MRPARAAQTHRPAAAPPPLLAVRSPKPSLRSSTPPARLQFIRDRIQANMEDPAERDRKWEQHLRGVQQAAANA